MDENTLLWAVVAYALLHLTLGYWIAAHQGAKAIRKAYADHLVTSKRLAMAEHLLQRLTNSDPAKLIDFEMQQFDRRSYSRMWKQILDGTRKETS